MPADIIQLVSTISEETFRSEILCDPEMAENAVPQLYEWFQGAGIDEKIYTNILFRRYTALVWYRLSFYKDDIIVDAVATQIPTALLLDYDIVREMLLYLAGKPYNRQDIQNIFVRMQKAFSESEIMVGKLQGKEVKLADLVTEYKILSSQGAESIKTAEFRNNLEQTILNKDIKNLNIGVEPEVCVNRFAEAMEFFVNVKENEIYGMLNVFLHPKIETKTEVKTQPAKIEIEGAVSEPKMSGAQIKSQINSEFKKNQQGEFINMEGVLNRLNELSEKYKDPKIAELYYFDEKDGKFKWAI